jgi:Rrf2 family protein
MAILFSTFRTMRVSAKAEYACIAMIELATSHAEPQPVRIKAIADNHAIPQRFLVQILLQLKGAGLVTSVRGAAGGYQLARPPEDISLADIVNIIDRVPGPRPATAGVRSPAALALHGVWKDVQLQEQRLLKDLTLADLVRRSQQSAELSYQI